MIIPSLKVSFHESERKAILGKIDECLRTGQISQGSNVIELEEKFALYTGAKHAIAVNSGTSAIEVVMRSLDVSGKEVLVPTNTFVATASGVLFAGGKVRLVDVSPGTLSIGIREIKQRVTRDTAGVIVVHIGGIVTPEIEEIRDWCAQEGLWLFEDSAHAHGSAMNGKFAGTFGIAGGFSFFATKIISSGEGGIIITDDDELAESARLLRNHGKPSPWITFHTRLGSNWRMSDITAVIALSQLGRLDEIIAVRERLATEYTRLIGNHLPGLELVTPSGRSSWYKYVALLPRGMDRESVKAKMKEKGIGLQGEVYGTPLHKQPIAAELGFEGDFPNADDVCSRHICLPLYPGLTNEHVEQVVCELSGIISSV